MKAQDLKNSILQMAVQGKLVEQDPNDEPASMLLERIREERAKLIKEKKVKAPKGGESVIYRGSDGSHYEKRGKGEPVCIDDEIPFEIPEGWEWARLGSVCTHIVDGDHNPPRNSGTGVPILSAANVHDGTIHIEEANRWVTKEQYEKLAQRLKIIPGSVLLTIVGTIGRTAVVTGSEPFALQRSVSVIGQLGLEPLYISNLLEAYANYLQSISSGTAQKGVYLGTISDLFVPIPPLAEQRRIVEKVDELMPLVEEYGRLEDAREALDASLPDRLRKSVLQLAVEGKLVDQNPADEPASALLECIREERAKLIKEKKIKAPKGGESVIYRGSDGGHYEKRGKGEPVCIDDEIPFEIPESWEWVRLGDLGDWKAGATPAKGRSDYYANGTIPWLLTGDLTDGPVTDIPNLITEKALEECSLRLNPIGSILVAMYGATIGKIGLLKIPATTNQACCACILYINALSDWVVTWLKYQKRHFIRLGEGGAQPNISREKIVSRIVPVPPLAEQWRIVKKVDQILESVKF